MKKKSKKVALFGMMIALSFVLSYLESLIPFNFGIPGIKLGLANLVVLIAIYLFTPLEAFAISMIKILLVGLTFGNPFSLLYSFAGGLLSFVVMLGLKKCQKFSECGVSVLGAVCHNIGQIAVAAVVLRTSRIVYYLPVLMISGVITGLLIGIISKALIKRLKDIIK